MHKADFILIKRRLCRRASHLNYRLALPLRKHGTIFTQFILVDALSFEAYQIETLCTCREYTYAEQTLQRFVFELPHSS